MNHKKLNCKDCGIVKTKENTLLYSNGKYFYSYCKACQRKRKLTWYKNNSEKARKSVREYKKNNRGKVNATEAKHRFAVEQATPKWLTKEHWDQIRDIYDLGAEFKLATDHYYPLQGKKAMGLHVPWNLQLLTKKQNSSKNNKLPIEPYRGENK